MNVSKNVFKVNPVNILLLINMCMTSQFFFQCANIYMLIYSYWKTTRNDSLLIDGFDGGLMTVLICTLNPLQNSSALWNMH